MKLFLYLVILGVLFVAYVRYLEATTVFLPEKKIMGSPQDIGLAYEDVYFSTIDRVKLNGWFIKAAVHESAYAHSTVIFLHGNAGNIGDRLEKIMTFHKMGLNVFIIDYRGYGKSKGKPTEKGMYYDAMAAWDYLNSREDINPKTIIVYGASLGGVAAIDLAVNRKVACLVLDSTFTSAKDMAKVIVPFVPSFLLNIKMDSVGKIKNIMVPKLFLHSPEDETIPFRLGKELFNAAAHPKQFIEVRGSHNEAYVVSNGLFVDGIKEFLDKYNLL